MYVIASNVALWGSLRPITKGVMEAFVCLGPGPGLVVVVYFNHLVAISGYFSWLVLDSRFI